MKKNNITVEYDGCYPNACSGTLTILENQKVIYQKDYCCHSSGGAYIDGNSDAHVEEGELIWEDADGFNWEIQQAVQERLEKVRVCCGGCI